MPGDNIKMTVELIAESPIAMDEGLRFAIREGGRTVGSGVVTKILAVTIVELAAFSSSDAAARRDAGVTRCEIDHARIRLAGMHRLRRRNYRTQKETRGADRLELKKFCRKERKHTPHKESRKK